MDFETLSGPEKVAIVILSLPKSQVQTYLGMLDDDEVEKALAAVSRMDEIPSRVRTLVLQEFEESQQMNEDNLVGGRKTAMAILESSVDSDRAAKILEKMGRDELRIDWSLRGYQHEFIAERIGDEHPQTIALVLSQLDADRGAKIIESLPETVQAEVVLRLACLDTVGNGLLGDLELGVAELFQRKPEPTTRVGGAKTAASMLNRVEKDQGNSILEYVDECDSETALSIRKRMLTFDDLINIDKRGFQSFLREVSTEDLAVALKIASDEMKTRVFENLSSRAAEQIREEIDLLGPMKLSDVESVQEQIVEVARNLEGEGRLSIDIGGNDDMLV